MKKIFFNFESFDFLKKLLQIFFISESFHFLKMF